MPGDLRARGRPHSGDHRHAGCESDRKRGVSIDPIGYDAGKKTKGIKRNAIVDTEGHLLAIEVIAANTQDRDCAADWTSTIGLSPVTVIVSSTAPTRSSALMGVVRFTDTSTPSRLTVANPGNENVMT